MTITMAAVVGPGATPDVLPTTAERRDDQGAGPGGPGLPREGVAGGQGRQPSERRLHHLLGRWWEEERPEWTERSWWESPLHDSVRRLLWLPAGPALVVALAELDCSGMCPVDHTAERMLHGWPVPGRVAGWPCACQVITAAAWDACSTWLAIRSAQSVVVAAGPDPVTFETPHSRQQLQDPAREELAHALRNSIPSMGNRIAAARALVRHRSLVGLVSSGAISAWAGRLVTDHLAGLEDPDADRVVAEVAHRVRSRLAAGRRPYHSAEVNRLARAARLRMCPEQAADARIRAFAHRRVVLHSQGDGMATLVAELAQTDAFRIHRRLTAIAAGLQADAAADGPSETRTRDQMRADVLVDLLLEGSGRAEPIGAAARHQLPARDPSDPSDPSRAGSTPGARLGVGLRGGADPAEVQVVVNLPTLLGLVDDPAEVSGLGPIPADVARTLAADGRWRAWIADAAGAVTATGSLQYTPSAGVARLVRARERHCRFPGCHQPWDLEVAPLAGAPPHPHGGPPSWRWTTPAGLSIADGPEPCPG